MVISALFYQFPPVKLIQNDPYEFLIVLMWTLNIILIVFDLHRNVNTSINMSSEGVGAVNKF